MIPIQNLMMDLDKENENPYQRIELNHLLKGIINADQEVLTGTEGSGIGPEALTTLVSTIQKVEKIATDHEVVIVAAPPNPNATDPDPKNDIIVVNHPPHRVPAQIPILLLLPSSSGTIPMTTDAVLWPRISVWCPHPGKS